MIARIPNELVQAICRYVTLSDLINLTSSSRTLRSSLLSDLKRRRMRERYKVVYSTACLPRPISAGRSILGQALELVLRGELTPSYIQEIECDCVPNRNSPGDYDWGTGIMHLKDSDNLQRAFDKITWQSQDEKQELFNALTCNDEEAALCLMLPLLSHLKILCTFVQSARVHKFVGEMSRHCGADILPMLELVRAKEINGEEGIHMKNLAREYSPLHNLCAYPLSEEVAS